MAPLDSPHLEGNGKHSLISESNQTKLDAACRLTFRRTHTEPVNHRPARSLSPVWSRAPGNDWNNDSPGCKRSSVGSHTSKPTSESTGSPQGCVLSPLLFLLLTHNRTATFKPNHITQLLMIRPGGGVSSAVGMKRHTRWRWSS
ncbi:unnamed protein product [Pleuronectes platessa]|uniref:Uncharacterized protein n=1 Tax=Pleuronectes platessa TaxID=8262 RepID=A0A9N7VHQ9_PLEPL|nr:unnamed protein product [Pleuronectes platessa]